MKKSVVFILMLLCVFTYAQDTVYRLESEKSVCLQMPDSAYNFDATREQNFQAWLGKRVELSTGKEFQYHYFFRTEIINKEILNFDEITGKNITEKESSVLPQVFGWELIIISLSSFLVLFFAQGACWHRRKFQNFWLLGVIIVSLFPGFMFFSFFGMESLNLKIAYFSLATISTIIFFSFKPKDFLRAPEKMRDIFIFVDIVLFAILFIFIFSHSVPIFIANLLGIILGFPTIRFWRRAILREITIG